MSYKRNPGQERARSQLLTAGKRFCLLYGGSRSGKTFELVGTIIERALLAPGSRHLIVRQEGTSAKRAILHGTLPEVVALRWPGMKYEWRTQDGFVELSNGSQIWVGGLNDDKALEKLLGNEYATIYINEASEVKYLAYTLLRSRLAQTCKTINGKPLSQRFYVDLNPTTRQHWTYRLWIDGVEPESQAPIDMDQFGHIVVNPLDNLENLSPEYVDDLRNLPPRARKRFLEGQYVEDVEDALWRRSTIRRVQKPPALRRIVVAIDPAVTLEAGSDETGIIAAGDDGQGNAYVLDDASDRYRPEDWARQALALLDRFEGDRIVAEVNQGGDLVESTIRAIRPNVPYRAVRATRSKLIRAEPVAALYERGKVFHVGEFPQLEDQMCLVAGTLIETNRGQVPIEKVRPGDMAMTRWGWRTIEIARETGMAYSLVDIESTDGRRMTCTETHPIFARGKFVPARSVRVGDSLLGSRNWASTVGRSRGVVGGITGCLPGITGTPRAKCFTGRYGRRTMALFPRAIIFTTKTVSRATTDLKTWIACRRRGITPSMSLADGTQMTACAAAAPRHGSSESGLMQCASVAEVPIGRHTQRGRDIARKIAGVWRDLWQRSKRKSASNVAKPTAPATHGGSIAVKRVTMRPTTPVSVYNLKVAEHPEFFANGILTHNCAFTTGFDRRAQGYSPDRVDALVWALTDLFPELTSSKAPVEDDDWHEVTEWDRNAVTGY